MATQWLTVASVAGEAAGRIEALFRSWCAGSAAPDPAAVDQLCDRLRVNGAVLPVVHFCTWVDRWLMGDLVPGPNKVNGRRYQVACLSPGQAAEWAERCGHQFPEQPRLASRLREAATDWELVAERRVIVVVREIIGPSTTDDEILAALGHIPEWLTTETGAAQS